MGGVAKSKIDVVGTGYCAYCPNCVPERALIMYGENREADIEWKCKYEHICRRIANIVSKSGGIYHGS